MQPLESYHDTTNDPAMVLRTVDFRRLADLIEQRAGINLPQHKMALVAHRLQRRLRALKIATLRDYCDFLLTNEQAEAEMPHFINALTTNKTEFFREPSHFDFLTEVALPDLHSRRHYNSALPLMAWSAACSTGMEVYTLAMVLAEWNETHGNLPFMIHGTDIDTNVLQDAARAVYHREVIEPVPVALRHKYLLRPRTSSDETIRIAPELRARTRWGHLNLMEGGSPSDRPFDIVFCRNVLIYFSKETQQLVLESICKHIVPGGYLFVSHSETLNGLSLPVKSVAPSTYVRL